MAKTKIEWTSTPRPDGALAPGYTFNGWIGCTHASPGCDNCYAEAGTNHRVSKGKGLPLWGADAHRQVTSPGYWRQPLRWNREAAAAGERRKVFCASLADVFEDDRHVSGDVVWRSLDEARVALWALIESTPNLDWLLLTKRPQNVLRMVPYRWLGTAEAQIVRNLGALFGKDVPPGGGWPRNVWIGTTCEDQQRAEERLPHLLRVPAALRFVSYEPALGPVDFSPWIEHDGRCALDCTWTSANPVRCARPRIDWLIVGGESGPGARPFDLAWARDAVAQTRAAGVPCFVKQIGANAEQSSSAASRYGSIGGMRDRKGGDMAEWPADLQVREYPVAVHR